MAHSRSWRRPVGACALVFISTGATAAPEGAVPPPPPVEHHQNSEEREVGTVYRCSGSARRFLVRYHDREGTVRFVGGSRNGRKVTPSDVAGATEALRKLDAVSVIYPQCGAASDMLLAEGLIGKKKALVPLLWTAEGLRPSPLQMLE